jgi:signal recognition particle receptor subunit beta
MWDIGGKDKIRLLWVHYLSDFQALIYVVDSTARERIHEAAIELKKILNFDESREYPLLVFANKQDIPGAMSTNEVAEKLGLPQIQGKIWNVIGSSSITGKGLQTGLDWISAVIGLL